MSRGPWNGLLMKSRTRKTPADLTIEALVRSQSYAKRIFFVHRMACSGRLAAPFEPIAESVRGHQAGLRLLLNESRTRSTHHQRPMAHVSRRFLFWSDRGTNEEVCEQQ